MPMEQENYDHFIKKLNITIKEINDQDYENFLKLLSINDILLNDIDKHSKIPFSGPYIYPHVKTFKDYLLDVLDIASFEQKIVLLPLLLSMFETLDTKVLAFIESEPEDKYTVHLKEMNAQIQALLKVEPVKILQEKIDNDGVKEDLILIIKHLKANISGQKNDRKTDYYSQWKVDLFTVIENRLAQTDSLSTSEYLQYLADIREVCAKKRNTWHFWSEPHSVAEFEAMLAASSLTDISSDTISESESESSHGM